MLSKKVSLDGAEFASPGATVWSNAESHEIELVGVPGSMQPSAYLASTAQDRKAGKQTKVRVSSLHNGKEISFRLEWSNPQQNLERTDTHIFPDGAALLFPLGDDAPLATMGDKDQPVNGWHWRADRRDKAQNNVAQGLGTTQVTDNETVNANATYDNGLWSLVFQRSLGTSPATNMKQFAVGATAKVAYAVWDGGNKERGGLKVFSPLWLELELGQ